jgi:hypothetical protein
MPALRIGNFDRIGTGTNPPQLDLLTLTVVARDLSGNEISYEDLQV